jgi:threonine/homoserine/homoserine lactone efflux protein
MVAVPASEALAMFSLAALALLLVPGPAVLYIVMQSAEHGRVAGLVSVAGVHLGTLVHVGAAAVGLSALIVSSAVAFSVVKYAGAAYLVYLGLRRLFARERPDVVRIQEQPFGQLFRRGAVVNVLNPKTALFFLAFLPQFVDPDAGPVALQTAVLGFVFVSLALASDSLYGLAAGTLGGALRRSRAYAGAQRWVSGSVFVGLGLATAVSGSKAKS